MILTIRYADFSAANIGTLSSYVVSKTIGAGAVFDIPSTVDKNSIELLSLAYDEETGKYYGKDGDEVTEEEYKLAIEAANSVF